MKYFYFKSGKEIYPEDYPLISHHSEQEFSCRKDADLVIRANSAKTVDKILANMNSLSVVTVICGGKKDMMDRHEASAFYYNAMMSSTGPEKELYTNVYCKIMMGAKIASDTIKQQKG